MNVNIRAQTCCKGEFPSNIVLYLDTASINWVQFSLETYSGESYVCWYSPTRTGKSIPRKSIVNIVLVAECHIFSGM